LRFLGVQAKERRNLLGKDVIDRYTGR